MTENDEWSNLTQGIIFGSNRLLGPERQLLKEKVSLILSKAREDIAQATANLDSKFQSDGTETLSDGTILGSDEQVEEHADRLVLNMTEEEANRAADALIEYISELTSTLSKLSNIATTAAGDIIDLLPTKEAALEPLEELRKMLTDNSHVNGTRRVLSEYDTFVVEKLAQKNK